MSKKPMKDILIGAGIKRERPESPTAEVPTAEVPTMEVPTGKGSTAGKKGRRDPLPLRVPTGKRRCHGKQAEQPDEGRSGPPALPPACDSQQTVEAPGAVSGGTATKRKRSGAQNTPRTPTTAKAELPNSGDDRASAVAVTPQSAAPQTAAPKTRQLPDPKKWQESVDGVLAQLRAARGEATDPAQAQAAMEAMSGFVDALMADPAASQQPPAASQEAPAAAQQAPAASQQAPAAAQQPPPASQQLAAPTVQPAAPTAQPGAPTETTATPGTDGQTDQAKPATRPLALPPGVSPPTFRDAAHRRAKWMQYGRSLEENGQRCSRSEKCPELMAKKVVGAHEKQYYFSLWCAKGSWAKIVVFEEHIRIEANRDERKYQWMTLAQLEDFYKDADVAKELATAKERAAGTWVRPHPEMPHVWNGRQFKVLVEDSQRTLVENILQRKMMMEGEIQGEAAQVMVQQQALRTAQALGHGSPAAPGSVLPEHAGGALALGAPSACAAEAVPKPASSAETTTGASARSDAEQEKIKTAMELYEREEQKKKDRLDRQIAQKEKRDQLKETPAFKAKKWSDIVAGHQGTCKEAISKCQDEDSPMPSNLAKEYETNFKKDLRSLNRLKGSLDSAIADPNSPKVAGDLAKAKKITEDYKVNQRTFNCLFKKYEAHLEQQEEGDDAEGDV